MGRNSRRHFPILIRHPFILFPLKIFKQKAKLHTCHLHYVVFYFHKIHAELNGRNNIFIYIYVTVCAVLFTQESPHAYSGISGMLYKTLCTVSSTQSTGKETYVCFYNSKSI